MGKPLSSSQNTYEKAKYTTFLFCLVITLHRYVGPCNGKQRSDVDLKETQVRGIKSLNTSH